MRKFDFPEAHGFDLVKEFCKRVVADEYDNYCQINEETLLDESSDEFKEWLEHESNLLYNEIMERVNFYCDFDGVNPPPEIDE